ncbi:MAG: bifunctional DNA-formamidopyrimidine glycosylase/DNA-(apurinic or apyrimidinic site) lyase [Candidatus Paceibacterota bacterium]
MPELPEVHTTTTQIRKELVGTTITDVWSDIHVDATHRTDTLKSERFYRTFKRAVIGAAITNATRRGKNILIELTNDRTILIHMKMTGHVMYGRYTKTKDLQSAKRVPENWRGEKWVPVAEKDSPLWDPYNRFIHLVFSLSNDKHLVLSDVRKFAKITLLPTSTIDTVSDISALGPDPFDLSPKTFRDRIRRKQSGRIKTVLMDQSVLAGVGNIYSDEALWMSSIHPETDVQKLSDLQLTKLHQSLKKVMARAIETGGDSDSDYRNIYGEKGQYQNFHQVYRKKDAPCSRRGCSGIIKRIVVGGRSAHFCPVCQKTANT